MASTASEIIATAKSEAEAAKQSAMSSLSGMTNNLQSGYNTQKQATTDYYTNMINNLQNAYNKNAKSAYATSMTDRQTLANSLNRMGLANSGYGVSQMLGINSAYSKNLAELQNTLATNTTNTNYQQQQALADLYNTFVTNRNQLDQYIYEAAQNAYNTAFANRYQAEQDAIANALEQQSLNLQKQYYNYLMSSGGGGGSSRSSRSSRSGGSSSRSGGSSKGSNSDVSLSGSGSSGSSVPKGYTGSLASLVKSLGYSVATNVDKLISKGVIESEVINGKVYYKAGPNAKKDVGINTKR